MFISSIFTGSDAEAYLDESLPALAVRDGRRRLLAAEHLHGLDGLFLARHAVGNNWQKTLNFGRF